MSEEMHNGLMCTECFVTIDLTNLHKTSPLSIRRNSPRTVHTLGVAALEITCPNCGAGTKADYVDIKPLENWKDAEKALDRRMETLEKRFGDPHFKADIAKEIMQSLQEPEATGERASHSAGVGVA